MNERRRDQVWQRFWVAVLGAMVVLGVAGAAMAQGRMVSAEVKRANGRVEILRRGETQWVPALVGARLTEGDDIRSYAGASAEIELPDTSTLLLAENSRLVVNKIEFKPRAQERTALFHLVVGKVRAVVAQAAISVTRARGSNFAISTPTAVAAARGTDFEVTFDASQSVTHVAVLREDHGEK